MFLVGPPGSTRRRIALLYCDAAQRDYEYVCLSRDTTEGDLKQRKELVAGAVQFVDSAPVRAARHGRILILDGVEKAVRRTRCSLYTHKLCITLHHALTRVPSATPSSDSEWSQRVGARSFARTRRIRSQRTSLPPSRNHHPLQERNVLPTLNNLLENREMALEDGTMLVPAAAFDALPATQRRNLIRVHPDFRVVALGVPCPPFRGHALDPPLRSRFEARAIPAAPSAHPFVAAAREMGKGSLLHAISDDTAWRMGDDVHRHFPYTLFPGAMRETAERLLVELGMPVLQSFAGDDAGGERGRGGGGGGEVGGGVDGESQLLLDRRLPASPLASSHEETLRANIHGFVETPRLGDMLGSMLQSHNEGVDTLVVGPAGAGKSSLAREFARRAGYVKERNCVECNSCRT